MLSVESQEKEDREHEARRPGSGRELSVGGAAGGRASTEAVWNESGVGWGAGEQTKGGRKDIKAKGADRAVLIVNEVRRPILFVWSNYAWNQLVIVI